MKKHIFCLTILAAIAAFAGSAEPDGTDFVVTAAAGESFTNSAAIGDYARLVKRGAGAAAAQAVKEGIDVRAVDARKLNLFK